MPNFFLFLTTKLDFQLRGKKYPWRQGYTKNFWPYFWVFITRYGPPRNMKNQLVKGEKQITKGMEMGIIWEQFFPHQNISIWIEGVTPDCCFDLEKLKFYFDFVLLFLVPCNCQEVGVDTTMPVLSWAESIPLRSSTLFTLLVLFTPFLEFCFVYHHFQK